MVRRGVSGITGLPNDQIGQAKSKLLAGVVDFWISYCMTRSNKDAYGATRKLSDADFERAVNQSLSTLEHLCATYDGGYTAIAALMAVEIRKIVSDNAGAAKLRGGKKFPTSAETHKPSVISARHDLVGARVGGEKPSVMFVPSYAMPDGGHIPVKYVDFRIWWHREPIYRASSAIPGKTPKGLIPVNDSDATPFAKRRTLTRMQLVDMVRNKVGAHTEPDLPELIDDLESGVDFAAFSMVSNGKELSTLDGTLPVQTGPLQAGIRQIAHEILVAYGRLPKELTA